ncbi:MAG: hypothetical protein ACPGXY_05065 [Alphaproteobacteria bacterium]
MTIRKTITFGLLSFSILTQSVHASGKELIGFGDLQQQDQKKPSKSAGELKKEILGATDIVLENQDVLFAEFREKLGEGKVDKDVWRRVALDKAEYVFACDNRSEQTSVARLHARDAIQLVLRLNQVGDDEVLVAAAKIANYLGDYVSAEGMWASVRKEYNWKFDDLAAYGDTLLLKGKYSGDFKALGEHADRILQLYQKPNFVQGVSIALFYAYAGQWDKMAKQFAVFVNSLGVLPEQLKPPLLVLYSFMASMNPKFIPHATQLLDILAKVEVKPCLPLGLVSEFRISHEYFPRGKGLLPCFAAMHTLSRGPMDWKRDQELLKLEMHVVQTADPSIRGPAIKKLIEAFMGYNSFMARKLIMAHGTPEELFIMAMGCFKKSTEENDWSLIGADFICSSGLQLNTLNEIWQKGQDFQQSLLAAKLLKHNLDVLLKAFATHKVHECVPTLLMFGT